MRLWCGCLFVIDCQLLTDQLYGVRVLTLLVFYVKVIPNREIIYSLSVPIQLRFENILPKVYCVTPALMSGLR